MRATDVAIRPLQLSSDATTLRPPTVTSEPIILYDRSLHHVVRAGAIWVFPEDIRVTINCPCSQPITMLCSVTACPSEAVHAIRGQVALMLGLSFHLKIDEDLILHLCQRHYDEALLVSKVVIPPFLERHELDHIE